MTEKRAIDAAPAGQEADTDRIAPILAASFDADNHETLDADITRLMLDLSADRDADHRPRSEQGKERLRTIVKAVLMALRRRPPVSGGT